MSAVIARTAVKRTVAVRATREVGLFGCALVGDVGCAVGAWDKTVPVVKVWEEVEAWY